ncbi:MAG: YitT family protein [Metamycoplasmataceae bacterium]
MNEQKESRQKTKLQENLNNVPSYDETLKNQEKKEKKDEEKITNSSILKVNKENKIQNKEENDLPLEKLEMGKYYLKNLKHEHKNVKEKIKFIIQNYWKRVLIVFLSALLFNFGINTFINRSETIPSGLTGFPTLLVLIFPKIKPYFALIYLGANIPLFLTFGLKEKKSFIILTLLFMLFQIPTNFFFTWTPINDFLYRTFNLTPNWSRELQVIEEEYISNITTEWYRKSVNPYVIENPTSWPILVYGVLGAICIAVAISLTWKSGGSTGGTDIVIYYFATKSKKNVASIFSLISLMFSLTFLIIFRFTKPHSISFRSIQYLNETNTFPYMPQIRGINKLNKTTTFGMRELSTLLYILINNIVLTLIYPKYAKVQFEVSCSNPDVILRYFKKINFWHAYSIKKVKSGYTGNDIYIIESVMLLLETKNLILDIKKIEPKAWISIKPVKQAIGKFNTSYVE